jgi:Holliday junction resolvase RusA-like endonuclease
VATACREASFAFNFKPVTSSRPRFAVIAGRAMAYHAAPYKAWLKAAAAALAEQKTAPFVGPLDVYIEVTVKTPQKTHRLYPVGDVDNYAKGPLDALKKAGIYTDDDQVVWLKVTKRYGPKEGVVVRVEELA